MPVLRALRWHGRFPLVCLGFSAVVRMAGTLALPLALGHAVDALIRGEAVNNWVAWVIAIVLSGLISDLVDLWAGTVYVVRQTAVNRVNLVSHLVSVDPRKVAEFGTGDLVSRVSAGSADAAQEGPSRVGLITGLIPPAGSLVLLFAIDFWLGVAFLAGIAVVALILRAFARQTAAVLLRYQEVLGRIASRLTESLGGARTIAAAGSLSYEERRVLEPLPSLRQQGNETWRVMARSSAQAALAAPLIQVTVIGVGAWALMRGRISVGELFAATQYALIGAGLGGLTGVLSRLARARSGRARIREVANIPPVVYGEADLPPGGRGELCVAGVTIPAGAMVAVVGRTGSGKSGFAGLAARLHDCGVAFLDGVALQNLSRQALRRGIGVAFERPVLFGQSILDALGPGLRRRQVIAAATATQSHGFITRLPGGYDTPLPQVPLSGGERQRLGLARAWNAERLLVLDDATSSLDTVTEMHISRAMAGDTRTRLIVTHRMATAARADFVVWLESGAVRAVGAHDRLWAEHDGYREVFR